MKTFRTPKNQIDAIARAIFKKSFEAKKTIQHNRDLHATSEYLADQARKTERMMDRARWSR